MKKIVTGLMVLMLAGLAMAEPMTIIGKLMGDDTQMRVRGADKWQINFKTRLVPAGMLEGLVIDGQAKIVAEVKPHATNPLVFFATEVISLEMQ